MLKKIGFTALVISIPICILLTTIQFIVLWDGFFESQYKENNVIENTSIKLDHLMDITDEIQGYLFGQRDDLFISSIIGGQEGQVFKEREIIHMEDVKSLFHGGILLRNASILLLLIFGIFFWRKDKIKLYQAMKYSAVSFVIFGIIFGWMITQDFNKYFVIFHKIFFRNDFWILNPAESVLINMVDIHFFMNIVKLILGISSPIILFIGVLGVYLQRKSKQEIYSK